MISEAMLDRMRAAAAESREIIDAGPAYCRRCGVVHPPTFTFRGRQRGWHDVSEAQMSPVRRAARSRAA